MGDTKSKLPDLKELGSMGCKLMSGIKNTVVEIIQEYKNKHATPEDEAKKTTSVETQVTEEIKKTKKTKSSDESTSDTEKQKTAEKKEPVEKSE